MWVFVFAVTTALVVSFVCSISEAVLLSVRHAHFERMGESRVASMLRNFKRQIDRPIAAILVLNTVANTMGAAVAGAYYGDVFHESTLWIFTLAFTVTVLLFTEILPKTLGVHFVSTLAIPVAYLVTVSIFVLRPVLAITGALSRLVTPRGKVPVTSLDEIRLLTILGRTEGVVATRVAEMIEGAAALRTLRAGDVMVPRAGMVYLSGQRDLDENLAIVRGARHSRFPFTPSGNLDDVSGIILTRDLLFHVQEQGAASAAQTWPSVQCSVLFIPGVAPLERLLRRFQDERRHLAIVVDEYGGVQGMVTLEDVLEEIVGEIEDESDRADPFILTGADGSLVCRGWAETRKVLEALGVVADVDAVSIGGFVADLVGRVPQIGDRVRFGSLEFEVLEASGRRAERVVARVFSSTAAVLG